jgi:hypothetical protein
MKTRIAILAIFAFMVIASAGNCPYTSAKSTPHCRLDITPLERLYGQPITLKVSYGETVFEPVEDASLRIEFYDEAGNKTLRMLKTDKDGIAVFTPEVVNYHLMRLVRGGVCQTPINLLVYVNTTCGDGICADWENRLNCPEDCAICGDGICDINEDLSCPDCAVCGDGICSAGETRSNCLIDCVVCGDGICDYLEDYGLCPDDCPSGGSDGFCDGEEDGIRDPDCEPQDDPDCMPAAPEPQHQEGVTESDEGDMSPLLAFAGVLAIVAGAAASWEYIRLRKCKKLKQDADSKPKEKKPVKKTSAASGERPKKKR